MLKISGAARVRQRTRNKQARTHLWVYKMHISRGDVYLLQSAVVEHIEDEGYL